MVNFASGPLISVGILASTSIEILDDLLEDLRQQTHQNLEILVTGGAVRGPALVHYLRTSQAKDSRIKYVPCQDQPEADAEAAFSALLAHATGEFFTIAVNDLRWHPQFLERCLAEMGSHGTAMAGASVAARSAPMPVLGGGRSRRQNVLAFMRTPTAAVLLGVHRTSWLRDFYRECRQSGDLSATLLRSVYRGHLRVFPEVLCDREMGLNLNDGLMPDWFRQGIHDLADLHPQGGGSPGRKGIGTSFLSALGMLIRPDGSRRATARSEGEVTHFARRAAQQEMKESFSQSGEDMIADFIFGAIQIQHPTYLDLGAHHPRRYSNTHHFYRSGSRGVNVEADPSLHERFIMERPSDINLNVGVGVGNAGVLPFYVMSVPTLNTFSKEEADRCVAMGTHEISDVIEVPLRDVNDIIQEYFAGTAPDFMSIDVEGLDLEIVKAIDFERYRPVVICVETITFSENFDGVKIDEIGEYLESRGYFLYADTRINSIFVDKARWRR